MKKKNCTLKILQDSEDSEYFGVLNKNFMKKEKITPADFDKIEMRTGTILTASVFTKAHKPAYILTIDFGELGILKSSAQISDLYNVDDLPGRQIIAVTNFPPKQIADIMSECLVLGVVNADNKVVLLTPDRQIPNGLLIS